MSAKKSRPAWTPSEARLVAQYARSRAEKEVEDYATAKADAERGIQAIKAKARAEAFNDARHTMQLSLDAAINPLRAEAWDEGAAAAFRDTLRATPGIDFSNPYRKQEEA